VRGLDKTEEEAKKLLIAFFHIIISLNHFPVREEFLISVVNGYWWVLRVASRRWGSRNQQIYYRIMLFRFLLDLNTSLGITTFAW